MMRFLHNDEIDRSRWDHCISNSARRVPYAYSWYLDNICPGWNAVVDDSYSAVFPVPVGKRFGTRYVYTPVFIQRLGLFTVEEALSGTIGNYTRELSGRYRFVDLALNLDPGATEGRVIKRETQVLKLDLEYEVLRKGYSEGARRNLRKVNPGSFSLDHDIDPWEAISLFRSGPGKRIGGIKRHDFEGMGRLMQYCVSTGKGRIIGARKGSKLIYSLFSVETDNTILLLFPSTSLTSRAERVGFFVVDLIIRNNAASGKTIDFAGSSIDSVRRFNSSFGATGMTYFRYYMNSLSWPVRLLR